MKNVNKIVIGLLFAFFVFLFAIWPREVQAAPNDQEIVNLMREQNRYMARIAESMERMSGQKPPLK
jgi:hypothetical protein